MKHNSSVEYTVIVLFESNVKSLTSTWCSTGKVTIYRSCKLDPNPNLSLWELLDRLFGCLFSSVIFPHSFSKLLSFPQIFQIGFSDNLHDKCTLHLQHSEVKFKPNHKMQTLPRIYEEKNQGLADEIQVAVSCRAHSWKTKICISSKLSTCPIYHIH